MTVNELIKQLQETFMGTEEIHFETWDSKLDFVEASYNKVGYPTFYFEAEECFEE